MAGPLLGLALGLSISATAGHGMAESPRGRRARRHRFAYSRFGEDQYGPGSITLDQFDAHIAELADGGHTVLPSPSCWTSCGTDRLSPTVRRR